MPKLTDAELAEFLQAPGVLLRIGVVREDGSPLVVPIWFIHRDGAIHFTPREKSEWFFRANEIHGGEIKGPYPFDDGRFAAWMSMEITPKEGPMAGQRIHMEEVALYHVDGGQIVKEEFFYGAEGC